MPRKKTDSAPQSTKLYTGAHYRTTLAGVPMTAVCLCVAEEQRRKVGLFFFKGHKPENIVEGSERCDQLKLVWKPGQVASGGQE